MGSQPADVPPAPTRPLDGEGLANVQRLLERAALVDGHVGLSDQLLLDLQDGAADGGDVTTVVELDHTDGDLTSAGVASRRDGAWTMQVVVDPRRRHDPIAGQVARRLLASIGTQGGGRADWWVFAAGPAESALAGELGFRLDRELLEMRRSLPVERRSGVTTRGFLVGRDESAWLAVNNRAFAGHHEQGGWTIETLRQRMRQRWFDPDDVRLHERDGRLAAFCWTKRHDDAVAEIYVIGVDPDFQGLGLGSELTLSGLEHMVRRGASTALLFVAAENRAARAMYERLGFAVERVDVAFVGDVRPAVASVTR